MAASDRAFRALAHHAPDAVARALRLLAPDLFAAGAPLTRFDVAPTRLDALAPPRDADLLLRTGEGLRHVQGQGYGDAGFSERVFWYHLEFACAYRPLLVRTLALWLLRPPEAQRREWLSYGDIGVRVRHELLPEVRAELLLRDPACACFAAAANPGAWPVEQLCREVASRLRASGASFYRRHMAVVCAATQGRYDAMVKAMTSCRP